MERGRHHHGLFESYLQEKEEGRNSDKLCFYFDEGDGKQQEEVDTLCNMHANRNTKHLDLADCGESSD